MKNNRKDEPLFGNEHLPKIKIEVPQACIDYRKVSKELILVEESLHYTVAIFNVLMMVSDEEIHRDTDVTFAIRTLAYLGAKFGDIGSDSIDRFLLGYKQEGK